MLPLSLLTWNSCYNSYKYYILENYLVYPSIMPARPKPLPRPCPQCGKETGGCQLVVFNPRYQELWTGYRPWKPIVVLRISHGYSKVLRAKTGKRKKIVHNFQTDAWGLTIRDKPISTDELFDQPGYEYLQSVSMPAMSAENSEVQKERGPLGKQGRMEDL